MDSKALNEILDQMKKLKAKWCDQEVVDDPEEMWSEIPDFLMESVSKMEKALES